jgi:hypothetical protein
MAFGDGGQCEIRWSGSMLQFYTGSHGLSVFDFIAMAGRKLEEETM